MNILYVFPHPDDESFGPAPVLARQRREDHDVFLLTLTRGEATAQRAKYGYSKEEMGRVRYEEMQDMARTLGLTELTVLDFPDGELADLDPRVLEEAVAEHIAQVQPAVVATYAVHGISGHPDHLAAHAVVKRAYCALHGEGASSLRRLAFFTLPEENETGRPEHLKGSPAEAVDVVVPFTGEDRAQGEAGLACYETYRDVIEEHRPLDHLGGGVRFELFQEDFDPPLKDLFEQLPA